MQLSEKEVTYLMLYSKKELDGNALIKKKGEPKTQAVDTRDFWQ